MVSHQIEVVLIQYFSSKQQLTIGDGGRESTD